MKKLTFIFLTILISLNAYSTESNTIELLDFKKLVIIGNFSVDIIKTSEQKEAQINVKDTNEVKMENLSFTYANKTLTIRYQGSFVREIPLALTIYYPENIPEIEARRGVEIRMEEAGTFKTKTIYKVENGSKLLIKGINAPKINAEISKGGSIRIEGETKSFDTKVVMGGTIAAVRLFAEEVNARVSMGGEIICHAKKSLIARVASGGTISYQGNPKNIDEKITLGGTIEKI